jgi:hypothetical protein
MFPVGSVQKAARGGMRRLTTKGTCAHGQPLLGTDEHPPVHD